MRSSEQLGYASEPVDPILLAYSRLPFRWSVNDSHEIPFSLVCLGVRQHDGTSEDARPLTVALNWMPQNERGHNLHIELMFFHRPLKNKRLSYNEAEGGFSIIAFGLMIMFLPPQFPPALIRKDPKGILPRIIMTALPNDCFRVDYRHRADFAEVMACLLGANSHFSSMNSSANLFSRIWRGVRCSRRRLDLHQGQYRRRP